MLDYTYNKKENLIAFCFTDNSTRKKHRFDLPISEWYSSSYLLDKIQSDELSGLYNLTLITNSEDVSCPFCGSREKMVQKRSWRRFFDLFQLDGEDVPTLEWPEVTFFLNVLCDNLTFRCGNKSCRKLFKQWPFLKNQTISKSHFSPRMRTFICSLSSPYGTKEGFTDLSAMQKLLFDHGVKCSLALISGILHTDDGNNSDFSDYTLSENRKEFYSYEGQEYIGPWPLNFD